MLKMERLAKSADDDDVDKSDDKKGNGETNGDVKKRALKATPGLIDGIRRTAKHAPTHSSPSGLQQNDDYQGQADDNLSNVEIGSHT